MCCGRTLLHIPCFHNVVCGLLLRAVALIPVVCRIGRCCRRNSQLFLSLRKTILTDVDHSKRGEAGIARIKLKQAAVPQRVGPYGTVGVRDAAFRELISQFFERGMLEKLFSSWAARAFCLPRPGGKWRLVIDYRYLNSQIADEAFPLPVIEDLFLEQSKNAIWCIFDLEERFHQMVLGPGSRPLTAFVTTWGPSQWTVLPMGLRMAPEAYLRMVQLCLEETGVKPYIDDVLRGTPDTEDNPDLDAPVTDGCIRQHFEDVCHIFNMLAGLAAVY